MGGKGWRRAAAMGSRSVAQACVETVLCVMNMSRFRVTLASMMPGCCETAVLAAFGAVSCASCERVAPFEVTKCPPTSVFTPFGPLSNG